VQSAGVVAEHSAERAVIVSGGVRTKGQVFPGLPAKNIKHQARPGAVVFVVEVDDPIEVPAEIHHDRGVAALGVETVPPPRDDIGAGMIVRLTTPMGVWR
jgi:hypothetical protein